MASIRGCASSAQSALTKELMSCTLEEEVERLADEWEMVNDDLSAGHPPNFSSLLSASQRLTCEGDIGKSEGEVFDTPPHGAELQSERRRVLQEINHQLGSQVTRRKLQFAPPWIIDKAFMKEYESNCADAYSGVQKSDIPADANIIASHVVYKVKVDEEGEMKLKARIVPHENRDSEKDDVRKDSATAQLGIIRLLLSLTTFLGFTLATADIAGAY